LTVVITIEDDAFDFLKAKTLSQPLHIPMVGTITDNGDYYSFSNVCEVDSLPPIGNAILLQMVSLPFENGSVVTGNVLKSVEIS